MFYKSLFKDIDYEKAEFVDRSVKFLQKFDESDLNLPTATLSTSSIASLSNNSINSSTKIGNSSSPSSSTTAITLNDCFELFTEREHLTDENSWMCPKCQKQTNAYKELCISKAPPILIIHLKRFFYKSKASNFKLTTPVWFPINSLNISKYLDKPNDAKSNVNDQGSITNNSNGCSPNGEYITNDSEINYNENEDNEDCMYDLFAIANHKGQNMANGHYTGIYSLTYNCTFNHSNNC